MFSTKDYPVGRGAVQGRYIQTRTGVPAKNKITYAVTDVTATKFVVVNGVTYTFQTAVAAAGDVKVGGSADASWLNFVRCINKSGGTEGAGQDYMAANGVAHPSVSATIDVSGAGGVVTLTAIGGGAFGNSFTLTKDEAQATLTAATFYGGSDAEAPLVFDGAIRYPGVAHEHRHRVTIVEVNAGHTLLPAIPGWKYRLVDASIVAIGGAAGTVTTVDILGTLSSGRKLVAFARASLLQDTVCQLGGAVGAVLADGASFTANDANTAITISKTGGDVDTATHFDVVLKFALEAA